MRLWGFLALALVACSGTPTIQDTVPTEPDPVAGITVTGIVETWVGGVKVAAARGACQIGPIIGIVCGFDTEGEGVDIIREALDPEDEEDPE